MATVSWLLYFTPSIHWISSPSRNETIISRVSSSSGSHVIQYHNKYFLYCQYRQTKTKLSQFLWQPSKEWSSRGLRQKVNNRDQFNLEICKTLQSQIISFSPLHFYWLYHRLQGKRRCSPVPCASCRINCGRTSSGTPPLSCKSQHRASETCRNIPHRIILYYRQNRTASHRQPQASPIYWVPRRHIDMEVIYRHNLIPLHAYGQCYLTV